MASVRILMAALLLNAPLRAQDPPVRALTDGDSFRESFDLVHAVRELPGGKVLLVDHGPRLLYLLDFTSGTHRTIGGKGQGPGEYQFPTELVMAQGDTTLLLDRMTRRLLTVDPEGKVGPVVRLPEHSADVTLVRGDRRGRLYLQAEVFSTTGKVEDDFQRPDSASIMRWDRGSNRLETVARIKLPETRKKVGTSGASRTLTLQAPPFAAQDDWGVTPDGRVGVVRFEPYQVEWWGERPMKGSPVRYTPVRVGAAEREEFMRPIRERKQRSAMGSSKRPAAPPPAPTLDEFDWPEMKPAFVSRSSLVSPEGELWVLRSAPARDSVPVYDLFNASGNLTARVSLPKGRRLVGIGAGVAYAIRTDDDGLQWLERYQR